MANRHKVTQLEVDGLSVTLTRKRMRSIIIRVDPDGTVRVSAPYLTSDADVAGFVRRRRAWIDARRTSVLENPGGHSLTNRQGKLLTGDTLPLWGKPLTLFFDSSPTPARVSCKRVGDHVRLHVPRKAGESDADHSLRAEKALRSWYARELGEILPEVAARCEARVGKHASGWSFRWMKSRWGSCKVSTAKVTLNSRLAQYPPECLEEVVTHELCHLWVPRHDRSFYSRMDKALPDWRTHDARLKRPPLG